MSGIVVADTLKSLFAVTERYPVLKANQHFLRLQEELTSTEDRIAYSRQFFDDSVQNKRHTALLIFVFVILTIAVFAVVFYEMKFAGSM